MPPGNEPKNLLVVDCELEAVRLAELDNLQARIDFNQARNSRVGKHLNTIRLLTLASPIVFVVSIAVLWLISL